MCAVYVYIVEARWVPGTWSASGAAGLAASPGAARAALKKLSAARPARMDLDLPYRHASAVLEDRHVVVHSVAMSDIEDSGASGLGICNPRRDAETRITAPQVVDHAHDIRRVTPKVLGMIAETMDSGS